MTLLKNNRAVQIMSGKESTVYHETIPWRLMKYVSGLFFILTVFFLALFINGAVGYTGKMPAASNIHYLIMSIVYIIIGALLVHFRKLDITVDSQAVTVSFGMFSQTIAFERIESCSPDTTSALLAYGGWGIRYGRVGGYFRRVYNVYGCKNLVLTLKEGRIRQFVFSTKRPDELKALIDASLAQ